MPATYSEPLVPGFAGINQRRSAPSDPLTLHCTAPYFQLYGYLFPAAMPLIRKDNQQNRWFNKPVINLINPRVTQRLTNSKYWL